MSPSSASTSPLALSALLAPALQTLHNPLPTDPITECPQSALHILSTYPAALIKLAHSKIHSFPFNEVPLCWRRLYTDASIGEAINIIALALKSSNDSRAETEEEEYDWMQEVVKLLDMAIIMTGAPER